MKKAQPLIGLLFAVFLSAACTAPASPTIAADWVEPAWMSQVRQETADYQASFISCLEEQGVKGYPAVVGYGVFTALSRLEDGSVDKSSPAESESVSIECSQKILPPSNTRQPPDWKIDATPQDYQRMLDVRDCLIAHDVKIPSPPSMVDWIDSDWPWNPWAGWEPQTFMSAQDLQDLGNACPQDGVSIPLQISPL